MQKIWSNFKDVKNRQYISSEIKLIYSVNIRLIFMLTFNTSIFKVDMLFIKMPPI